MQNKTTLILAAIAIVLAGGVAVIEFGSRPQQQAVEADRQRLIRLEPEAITGLSLTTEIDSLSLTRGESGWRLSEPITSSVDVVAVDTLLSTLTTVRPTNELGDIENWADLGLEPPRNRLEITTDSGTVTLDLGEPTFDNQGRYARMDTAETAVIIGADLDLTPTLFALRDKSLLGFNREEITAVSLMGRDGEWQIQRNEAGVWQAATNPEIPLSLSAVDTFLNQLAFLQASAFVAESQTDLAAFGLAEPVLSVALERDGAEPLTLQLGEELEITPPGQYVATSEIAGVATISIDQVATWPQTLADLRDRRLAEITPTLIGEIEIVAANPDLNRSLSRKPLADGSGTSEEFWLISDQPEREVLLDALLQPLIEAEALRFEAAIDTSEPSFSLILSAREGIDQPTIELSFGEVSGDLGGEVWATSSAQPDVLILPQDTLRTLLGVIDALQPEVESAEAEPADTEPPEAEPSEATEDTPTDPAAPEE